MVPYQPSATTQTPPPSTVTQISISTPLPSTTTASITLIQAICALCPVAPVVVNAGFETGTLGSWISSVPNQLTFKLGLDSAKTRDGKYAAKVSHSSSPIPPLPPKLTPPSAAYFPGSSGALTISSLAQTISVCAGQSYNFSAWATISGGTLCYLQICADSTCGPGFQLNTNYQQNSFAFNGRSAVNATLALQAYCTGGNVRTVDLDTVAVVPS